jgi:hypothetical protein
MSFADSQELAFVEELRRLTRAWPTQPHDLRMDPPEYEQSMIAWLDICDADENVALLTVGIHVSHGTLRGDQLHNQLLLLPDRPSGLGVSCSGAPERLAVVTDEWLRAILSRPFVRYEWGSPPHIQWRTFFADTGAAIVETRDCPPQGTPPDRTVGVRIRY